MTEKDKLLDQSKAFWKTMALTDMNKQEWESLCDGCAKCCLVKLQDEDTDEVAYTNVACRYMDYGTCQCTEYIKRNELVPACVWLKPEMVDEFFWLPTSCAYRLVSEGRDLPSWHPLISGDKDSVHEAGMSIRNKVINESEIDEDDLEEHIIYWVE
ncbi:MAG: YcgN family cysteine cluster protein [Pseudomonadales bacterium]|nr:YcgN family cysteine cluster protein [Pseudomonadales bacterium]